MRIESFCKNNAILGCARPETLARMASCGIFRKYRKGELIYREREGLSNLYFLAGGYVALFRTSRHQDRKVIFVYGDGELLNEIVLQEPVSSISCVALTDVRVLCFSRERFLDLMESDFALTQAVTFSLSLKLRRCYRQLSNTPYATRVDRQVASKLWKLGRDFGVLQGGMIRINFELSITFLADMVGSKRETVSRVVKKLIDRGLLKIERNYFYIPATDQLLQYITNREPG